LAEIKRKLVRTDHCVRCRSAADTSIAFGLVAIIAAGFLGGNRKYLTDRAAAKIRN
jgi:translation elongation factor EF-1beta